MKRAYLDTSAVSCTVKKGITGQRFRDALEKMGFEPAVGAQTIFETAKNLRDASLEAKIHGQTMASFIRELEPHYQLSTQTWFEREIEAFRNGTTVLPFYSWRDLTMTKLEVAKLRDGILDGRAVELMEEHDLTHPAFLKVMEPYLRSYLPHRNSLGSFENFMEKTRHLLPDLIGSMLLQFRVSSSEKMSLAAGIDKYPAIHAGVRADFYMNYCSIRHQQPSGRNILDDHRHMVESAYCDAIITSDRGFLTGVKKNCPHLAALKTEDVIS